MTETPEKGSFPDGLVGAGAVLVALAGIFLWTLVVAGPWRLGSGLLETADRIKDAEKQLSEGDFDGARETTAFAVAASERARAGADGGGPLLDVARLLPVASDALKELDHFVKATEYSSVAAFESVTVASDAIGGELIRPDPEDEEHGSIIDLEELASLAGRVHNIRIGLQNGAEELEAIDPKNLPRRFRLDLDDALEQAAEADIRLADAEVGFELLPGILGADGPRNYLLGFQNNAEQRGTGGAILQFSTLSVDNGRVQLGSDKKAIQSVYELEGTERNPIDIPLPEDAWIVNQIPDAQRFGNANWSPDWPSAAKLMLAYAGAADEANEKVELPEFDGFIGVDPFAVEKMMPGVGPFQSEAGNWVSSKRIVPFVLYYAYGKFPIPGERRAVLRKLVDGFFSRAVNPKEPTELLEGAGSALAEKRIQLWMKDRAEQGFVKHMGWDGAIAKAKKSDYVMVVEQNVGGNKLDYFSEQTTDMDVTIEGTDAHVSTELGVHNGLFGPQPRWIMGIFKGYHKPMISLYVPGNATLNGAPTVTGERLDDPAPAVWTNGLPPEDSEAGKKVWSATFRIPPGEDASIGYDYTVPGVVRTVGDKQVYRLVIGHQPKVNLEEMTITLTLPEGAVVVSKPKGWTKEGNVLTWTGELKEDIDVEVSWRS